MSEPIIIHPVGEKRKKSVVGTLIGWVIYLLILAVVYWFTLPPIHWQSKEFWYFVLFALILRLVMSGFGVLKRAFTDEQPWSKHKVKDTVGSLGRLSKWFGIGALAIVLFLLVGNCLGFELFHADRYANLLTTQTGDFSADVAELSQENIPVVDKDTAERLGLLNLCRSDTLIKLPIIFQAIFWIE